MNNYFAVLLTSLLLSGCGATLQSYERLNQSTNIELNTHIGGSVFKVEHTADLVNAFGKADIFGGKVDRGFTELRYQGLTPDKKLIFRITEIETKSTETTMSRYGGGRSTVSANTTYSAYGSQTYGTVIHQPAPQGKTEILPPNTTEFVVDPDKTRELPIAGVKVRIIGFDNYSLRYMLSK